MRKGLVAVLLVASMFAASTTSAAPRRAPKAYTRGVDQEAISGTAIFHGFIETHGIPTFFRIYWGRSKAYGHRAYTFEEMEAFNGPEPVGVEGIVEGLRPNRTYHYRLVAWNRLGRSVGEDRWFRTLSR